MSADRDVAEFLCAVDVEVARARRLFPSSRLVVAALTEEVGELAQAMLKVAAGKWPATRIREEAIQVAAMACRVALEGDPTFTEYTEPDKAESDVETEYYVLVKPWGVYVKGARFFIKQGGLAESWGRAWRGPIAAESIEAARAWGESQDPDISTHLAEAIRRRGI